MYVVQARQYMAGGYCDMMTLCGELDRKSFCCGILVSRIQ